MTKSYSLEARRETGEDAGPGGENPKGDWAHSHSNGVSKKCTAGWVGVLMSPDVHFIIDPGVRCSGIDQSSCQTRGCARGQEADKISQVKGDEDLK